jgi:diguanylate cyclase (GGDEF)-like protein
LARLGGDEFAVILLGLQSRQDAVRVATNITEAVFAVDIPECPSLNVGASVGMCLFPADGISTVGEAVAAADRLMYASKKAGKGRVTTADGTLAAA